MSIRIAYAGRQALPLRWVIMVTSFAIRFW